VISGARAAGGSVDEQQDEHDQDDRDQRCPAGAVLDCLQVVAADAGLAVTWAVRPSGSTPEPARCALIASIAAFVLGRKDGVFMSSRASSTTHQCCGTWKRGTRALGGDVAQNCVGWPLPRSRCASPRWRSVRVAQAAGSREDEERDGRGGVIWECFGDDPRAARDSASRGKKLVSSADPAWDREGASAPRSAAAMSQATTNTNLSRRTSRPSRSNIRTCWRLESAFDGARLIAPRLRRRHGASGFYGLAVGTAG